MCSQFLKKLLLECDDLSLVAVDVPLIYGRRRADILTIQGGQLVAYEIKSKNDNLARLDAQLDDYLKVFDKVYLVVDKKFEKRLWNLPKKVGIYLFDSQKNEFSLRKKARKNTCNIHYQSLFIVGRTLENFRLARHQSVSEIRRSIVKKRKVEIRTLISKALEDKFLANFNLFKKNFEQEGKQIHSSDLYLLLKTSDIEYCSE